MKENDQESTVISEEKDETKSTLIFNITRVFNISDGDLRGYELYLRGVDGSITSKTFYEGETEFPIGFNFDTATGYKAVKTYHGTTGLFGGNGNAIKLESWEFIKK